MKIKLIKFDNFVTGPSRAHYNDAGADVASPTRVTVEPHTSLRIPLGFGIQLPDGFQAIIQPRSGLSSKGITTEIAPIDSGYTGEIHAIVTNHTELAYTIEKGHRVGQLVIMPIILAEFYDDSLDERGEAGFASTGD